jgi:hypothetical protein
MAEYLNPVTEVPQVGRRISVAETLPAPPSDHVIVGVYDNGLFKHAVVLNQQEYEEKKATMMKGLFLSEDYYLVSSTDARRLGANV